MQVSFYRRVAILIGPLALNVRAKLIEFAVPAVVIDVLAFVLLAAIAAIVWWKMLGRAYDFAWQILAICFFGTVSITVSILLLHSYEHMSNTYPGLLEHAQALAYAQAGTAISYFNYTTVIH